MMMIIMLNFNHIKPFQAPDKLKYKLSAEKKVCTEVVQFLS